MPLPSRLLLPATPASPRLGSAPRVGKLTSGAVVEIIESANLRDGTTRMHTEEGWVTYVSKDGKRMLKSFKQLGQEEKADLEDGLIAALIPRAALLPGDDDGSPGYKTSKRGVSRTLRYLAVVENAQTMRRERPSSAPLGSTHERSEAALRIRDASLRVEARVKQATNTHAREAQQSMESRHAGGENAPSLR